MSQAAKYTTAVVLAHLLVNIAHGAAHGELGVGLSRSGTVFVVIVVLISPLIAMVLVWTAQKRLGLILLWLSMFGSLLFGLYHHFLVVGPDHVHSQPASPWGLTFVSTAYLLLITEAIGTYIGVHFSGLPEGLRAKPSKPEGCCAGKKPRKIAERDVCSE